MKKMKLFRVISLWLACVLFVAVPGAVMAQEGEAPVSPRITLQATYPKLEAIAGDDFKFDIDVSYLFGTEAKDFDLRITAPPNWDTFVTPRYETEKKISAIRLQPNATSPERLSVTASAPFYPLPEPGEYKITFEVSSADLSASIELTAEVTARYSLNVISSNSLYNTKAKPGEDNFFSIEVGNLGTAPIENIRFNTTKPEGWTIDTDPESIETLTAFDSQTVEVNIKPPQGTIAGDYNITLRATSTQTPAQEIKLRVTVETPTIWGWVGVGIIVLVVAGLVVVFMRFSRR